MDLRKKRHYCTTLLITTILIITLILTAANSNSIINKQSKNLFYQICIHSAQTYYPNIDSRIIKQHCTKINKHVTASLNECIDQHNILHLFTASFQQCLIPRLQQNTDLMQQVYNSLIEICKAKTLQTNANFDSNKLDIICRQAAPVEMQYIARHLQHNLK